MIFERLGEHTLFNGNAVDALNILICDGVKVDMVFTDPPYRTTPRGSFGGTGGILKEELNMQGKVFEHNDIDISEWIYKVYAVLKDSGHCYIMCNNRNLLHYLTEIEKAKFNVFKVLVWKKDNCITNQYYMDNHEYIIFCRKGKAVKINNCGTKSVLEVANPKNKLHPTEKPVELTDILIENSTQKGDTVLDPFMGVGACGVSCENLGRKFIGVEIHKDYYDVTKKRILNKADKNAALSELAAKALDKQQPQKPDYEGDYDYAKCPVCGHDDFEYGVNNWGCNYCPKCGQALDWSDVE